MIADIADRRSSSTNAIAPESRRNYAPVFCWYHDFGRALVSFDGDALERGAGEIPLSVHLYFLVPLVPFRNVPDHSMEWKVVSIILAAANLSRPENRTTMSKDCVAWIGGRLVHKGGSAISGKIKGFGQTGPGLDGN